MIPDKKNFNKLNISLGFIPILITLLLYGFIPQNTAIYVGAITGMFYFVIHYYLSKPRIINFILLLSTIVLIGFSILALIKGNNEWAQNMLPLTLEIAVVIPLPILYMSREKYLTTDAKKHTDQDAESYLLASRFTIGAIQVIMALAIIHFILITLGALFTRSLENGYMWTLLRVVPPLVFIAGIVINQLGVIALRNSDIPEYIPVVDARGNVVGKVDKAKAYDYKNTYTNPIVRIAIVSQGMFFLCERPENRIVDKGKMDIPMETYLLFKEDIKNATTRLLKDTFPENWKELKPFFSIKYLFKNDDTNRLIYLFILTLDMDSNILYNLKFKSGKFWTSRQIEDNLNCNYFSELFENEYEHLKQIMDIREKYKVA